MVKRVLIRKWGERGEQLLQKEVLREITHDLQEYSKAKYLLDMLNKQMKPIQLRDAPPDAVVTDDPRYLEGAYRQYLFGNKPLTYGKVKAELQSAQDVISLLTMFGSIIILLAFDAYNLVEKKIAYNLYSTQGQETLYASQKCSLLIP